MRAYAYGSEIQILNFYTNDGGVNMCTVRCIDAGWILDMPTSVIDIR